MKQTIYPLTYKHQLENDKKKKILNQFTVFSRAGRAGKNNSGPTNTWSKDHEKQNSKNKNNKIN